MAEKGSKKVSIKGSTDKRMITATVIITLDGHFLPMQLIYEVKQRNASQESSSLHPFDFA